MEMKRERKEEVEEKNIRIDKSFVLDMRYFERTMIAFDSITMSTNRHKIYNM